MAHITSRKLSNSFEGALAGGGDPATSPLYVFGPFLKLIVVAGVAEVTFGASVWLVVFTIVMVSAMYRLVMNWVTDGSGGSGLTEEELGGWAVKINAGITFIEYTLTFLVSMAALVTFIADRLPALNSVLLGIQYRTVVAIAFSILTGWLVNRGPKVAARAFGPATAGVLLLLWTMVFSTIWKFGFHLPTFQLQAFAPQYVNFTLGGYARILAVMTGIEVFANLVAAYEGPPAQKSNKAFGSLLIIMGTASVTMLVVGPAIFRLSNPTNAHVSVFTQTMDKLLPAPLAYLGTLVSIAVLLSASAASAQGLQNLALGLTDRRYVPPVIGRRNRFGVADWPVWIEVGLVSLAFLFFGTREETYLALYAAGVFILLSMTGWAAAKRIIRELREKITASHVATLIGTTIAALLTTLATVIIFAERLREGAWAYFIFIPILYVVFTYFRSQLGEPPPLLERLGKLEEAMWGVGTSEMTAGAPIAAMAGAETMVWQEASAHKWRWRDVRVIPSHILVPLDGSAFAEQALTVAEYLSYTYHTRLTLLAVLRLPGLSTVLSTVQTEAEVNRIRSERETYLHETAQRLLPGNPQVEYHVGLGPTAETIDRVSHELDVDLVVLSTHGRSGVQRWLLGSVASKVIQLVATPILLIRPRPDEEFRVKPFRKVLVPLDGSEFSERVLSYARSLTPAQESEVILLTVPEVPEAEMYGVVADVVETLRRKAEARATHYLNNVAAALREEGLQVRVIVKGTGPARTIVDLAVSENVDVIMMATHGVGGLNRVFVGSVAERVIRNLPCPLFLLPIHEKRQSGNGQGGA